MKLERIKLIRHLQQSMFNFVYAHQKRKIAEKMHLFAIQNQNLLGCHTNTFIHDGVWYSAGDPVKAQGDYKPNRILHNDLKEEVIALLQKEFEAVTQQGTLQIHFGQVLVYAHTKNDLRELLPYPLHEMLDMVDAMTFNCGDNLTESEIMQFKKDNNDGITCLNSMLLLELLLSK